MTDFQLQSTTSESARTGRLSEAVDIVNTIVMGKEQQVKLAFSCLLARGHLLIEDLPGVGKTTLAHALATVIGAQYQRIQFTSDLLPADILGVSIYRRDIEMFEFHRGPIFAELVLADEINRATPKSQSALLESMAEGQVTIEGSTHMLPEPFFVIATQNPLEQYGTFPLPESQLDRFLMRIELGYPDRTAENRLLKKGRVKNLLLDMPECILPETVMEIQARIGDVHLSDPLLNYIQDILDFTRTSSHFHVGLSPRAGMAIIQATRSWAFINDRDFALPEDVQLIMPWVAGHRLRSKENLEELPRHQLKTILNMVPIP